MLKTPRSEVSASLRDLYIGSNELPWTTVIVLVPSANGQRAVLIGPGVVCSRVANGCSGRAARKHAIAVRPVRKRLGVGGVGRRASAIETPTTGVSGAATRPSVIGSGGARRRQLTGICRARASAQPRNATLFRHAAASGRVATKHSPCRMSIRASVFVAWRAAWRYVASSTASRVIEPGAGGCVARAC
jgi:hypothetical protein